MVSEGQDDRRRELAATNDPRVERTRARLVRALDDLLHDGDQVSVAAICARAGVGRSTFYTHFATVGDVVAFAVDSAFMSVSARDAARRVAHVSNRTEITRLAMGEILEIVSERRALFLYAQRAPDAERVRDRLLEEMSSSVREAILVERPAADADFVQAASDFIAGGMYGLLLKWVSDPRGRSKEQVTETVVELLPAWLSS